MKTYTQQITEILNNKYPTIQNPYRYYQILCNLLSNANQEIDWGAFTDQHWSDFVTILNKEQVGGCIYWIWKEKRSPLISKRVFLASGAVYLGNKSFQQRFYQELTQHILPALEELNTPVIVLKGGALAFMLYPNPALRPMGDLDILVSRDQIPQSARLLETIGYLEDTISEGRISGQLSHHIHLSGNQAKPITVELHYSLGQGSSNFNRDFSLDWYWKDLCPFTFENKVFKNAYIFAPASMLLHLAVHLVLQHGETNMGLLKYYDIHLLVTRWGDQIDWPELSEQARIQGKVTALYTALSSCVARFGTILPPGYLETLDTSSDPLYVVNEVKQKSQPEAMRNNVQVQTNNAWHILHGNWSWKQRAQIFWELLVPSPMYIRNRYHPKAGWLWPLYYSIRWLRAFQALIHLVRVWLIDIFRSVTKRLP